MLPFNYRDNCERLDVPTFVTNFIAKVPLQMLELVYYLRNNTSRKGNEFFKLKPGPHWESHCSSLSFIENRQIQLCSYPLKNWPQYHRIRVLNAEPDWVSSG